jgi:hypothetical protein
MENVQTTTSTDKQLVFKLNVGFLSSRFSAPGSFVVALLLFLLPFINFKCGSVKIGHITGVQAVFKQHPTVNENMFGDMMWPLKGAASSGDDKESTSKKTTPNKDNEKFYEATEELDQNSGTSILLLLAFVTGIAGAAFAFFKKSWSALAGLVAGLGAAGFMLLCAIMLFTTVRQSLLSSRVGGFGDIGISVSPSIWYYLSAILFVVAGWLSRRQYQACKAAEQQAMINEVMAEYPIQQQPEDTAGE